MKPYRSYLFVPGNRERMLAKAPTTEVDALLFDLEDAVPVAAKATARTMVADVIPTVGKPVFVRVNAPATGELRADVEAVIQPAVEGLFVPKVGSADEVRAIATLLDELEQQAGVPAGKVELVCMIETAAALREAYEIAGACERVVSICCSSGENGDLQVDLGCDWSPDGVELLYARSKIVADCRAAGRMHPVDGVWARPHDLDGLLRDTTLSKRLGYKGRTIIHPSHVEIVNRVYSPSPETVAYCRGLVAAFAEALASGQGSVTYEGNMIDYAMEVWANRILEQADMYGIEAAEA